jgi:hypothetical protein
MLHHPRSRAARSALVRSLAVESLEQRTLLATLATFDHPPTPYIQTGPDNLQFTSLRAGGATGTYMKFVEAEKAGLSALSFDRTDAFAASVVVAEFMFRDTYVKRRADAFDFALLSTAKYGNLATRNGADHLQGFDDSLSFRFLINRSINDAEERWNDADLQVIFDGAVVHDVDLRDVFDYQSGQWHRIRIVVDAAAGMLSVDVTPEGRDPHRVVDNLPVPGLAPYQMRAHFSNSSGSNAGNIDLDSLAVNFLKSGESYVTFDDWRPFAQENASPVAVKLRRFGDLQSSAQIRVRTLGGNATANVDYTALDQILTFDAGQDAKAVDLAMLNDSQTESNEYFWLLASSTTSSVKTPNPMASIVRIYDDETGRASGQSLPMFGLGRVPIHTVLLPDGRVMYWGRQHDLGPQIIDPNTGVVTNVPLANDDHGGHGGHGEMGHVNIFCSGHTLLADGSLFIAGGHEDDFIGTKTAFIYHPKMNHWMRLPDMAERRWYPTVLALPNGDVLILHGTIDSGTNFNLQPEVWEAATNTWRKINIDQDIADNLQAHQSNFYPRVVNAPDGRVFYFGIGKDTWFLDPRPGVTNPWTAGPQLTTGARPHSYGTVTEYAPGKILVVGGSDNSSADAEVIDLNEANPAFRAVSPMTFARRQHNATILPDGRVLISGGQSGPDLVEQVEVQLKPEIWDPVTEKFTAQSALSVERLYHSTGLLLPSGSVWTGGTGEPTQVGNARDQRNAQLFNPSYLYYTNRPEITLAPKQTYIGGEIYITTKRPLEVTSASLIRLGSVTHSLEQSAKFIPVKFSQAAGGLRIAIPTSANTLVPGFYHLTIVDYRGVPSESKIIQILPSGSAAFVSIEDAAATEAAGATADFIVRLTQAVASPTTISYRTLAASAKPGTDFDPVEQSIAIPAGELTSVISIPLINDATKEPTEWFSVDIFSAVDGAGAKIPVSNRRAHAILADDDGQLPPTISIADSQATEGNNLTLMVTLSNPSVASTFIPYVTVPRSASTSDFKHRAASITIPAGATNGTITVFVNNDGVAEPDEHFDVRLIQIPGLKLGNSVAQATIFDGPLPTITPENLSILEGTGGATTAFVVVRLDFPIQAPVSINYATKNHTAGSADYTATAGTLIFNPGETQKIIAIPINPDRQREPSEEFYVNFSAPVRAKLALNQIKVRILNDD